MEEFRSNEAYLVAQIKVTKNAKGTSIAADNLRQFEEQLRATRHSMQRMRPVPVRLKELQKAERDAVKARDVAATKYQTAGVI